MKRYLLLLMFLLSSVCHADVFDGYKGILYIPEVRINSTIYKNVQAQIREVYSVENTAPYAEYDTFYPETQVLSIPYITVNGRIYTNVRLKMTNVICINCPMNPEEVITVPTNLDQINYPMTYTKSAIGQRDYSPCKLEYTEVTYPKSWLGNNSLPEVIGAPLAPNIGRGVMMKDIMLPDNPTFNPRCSGNLRTEITKTIQRLKKLNVTHITIPQWVAIAKNSTTGEWYPLPLYKTYGALQDNDLTFYVAEAKRAGLKVIIASQFGGLVDDKNYYIGRPPMTIENYNKWVAAYLNFTRERSVFYQSIGVDMWGLVYCDMFESFPAVTSETIKIFEDGYINAIGIMRQYFKGTVIMPSYVLPQTFRLANYVDAITTGFGVAASSGSTSVTHLKQTMINEVTYNTLLNDFNKPGKTIIFTGGVQSRKNWYTASGHLEETGCTTGVNAAGMSPDTCVQRNTQPDFSLQAIHVEATLEAISALRFNANIIISIADMWETDSMISENVFPHIGASFRNKPAEGIIKKWYSF